MHNTLDLPLDHIFSVYCSVARITPAEESLRMVPWYHLPWGFLLFPFWHFSFLTYAFLLCVFWTSNSGGSNSSPQSFCSELCPIVFSINQCKEAFKWSSWGFPLMIGFFSVPEFYNLRSFKQLRWISLPPNRIYLLDLQIYLFLSFRGGFFYYIFKLLC